MWTSDIALRIYAIIKAEGARQLASRFPNIYFTDTDRAQVDAKFPTVYVHELPGVEIGQDLEGTSINGMRCTFQIDVTDNGSQANVNAVMDVIMGIMKGMMFTVTSMPEFQNTEAVFRKTARFRRVIGAGDTL